MARLLLTRALAHAAAHAAQLRAQGDDVLISPLLKIVPLPWQAPHGPIAGLIFTSANGVAVAAEACAPWLALPVYVVGEATARVARQMGFAQVLHPAGVVDGQGLFDWLATQRFSAPLLHLTGRDQTALVMPAALSVETRAVYAAELESQFTPDTAAALRAGAVDAVLLYSPRTARHFAHLYDALGVARDRLIVGALSPAIAAAAGAGWADVAVAAKPEAQALFDAVHLATARRAG